MASKSVPRSVQCPRRISLVRVNVSVSPPKLVYEACRAAIRRVTFYPPPATQIGRPPSWRGSRATMASSTW